MIRIDIDKIVEKSGLKKSFIAQELFPENGKKNEALQRVALGKGQLYAEQIVRLSEITGIVISDLFEGNPETWKMQTKEHICTFIRDTFRAEYDMQEQTLRLFAKETLFTEKYFHPRKSLVTIDEVIETLEENVKRYKKLN